MGHLGNRQTTRHPTPAGLTTDELLRRADEETCTPEDIWDAMTDYDDLEFEPKDRPLVPNVRNPLADQLAGAFDPHCPASLSGPDDQTTEPPGRAALNPFLTQAAICQALASLYTFRSTRMLTHVDQAIRQLEQAAWMGTSEDLMAGLRREMDSWGTEPERHDVNETVNETSANEPTVTR